MALLNPLPDFIGPKLDPFTNNLEAHQVKFIKILGGDIGPGQDGVPIKVKIDGRLYVLKVVRDSPSRHFKSMISRNILTDRIHSSISLIPSAQLSSTDIRWLGGSKPIAMTD